MAVIPIRILKLLAAMLCLVALISYCEVEDFFVYKAYRLGASLDSRIQEAVEPDGEPAQAPANRNNRGLKAKTPIVGVKERILGWLLTPRFYQASYLPA